MNLLRMVVVVMSTVALVTSCDEQTHLTTPVKSEQKQKVVPKVPMVSQQVVDHLEVAVANEQKLRVQAENKVEEESEIRQNWELATFGLGVLCVLGFFAGTSIGSRGRRHAQLPT